MVPWAVTYMVAATRSAKMVERFGQRRVVSSGLVISGAGLGLLAATSSLTSDYWLFAAGLVVMAVGMGMTTAPSTGAIMRSLPLHKAGVGSAVNDTTRELGGALGVAVLGSLVASHFRSNLEHTVHGVPAGARRSLADTLAFASRAGGARRGVLATAAREAYVHAFDATLWISAAVVVVAAGAVAWLLRPAAARDVVEVVTLARDDASEAA
jgi:MFS family permease